MAHDAGSQPAEVPVSSAQPTSEEVRAQLAWIVASPDFDVPERSRGFLRYVVEETLTGSSTFRRVGTSPALPCGPSREWRQRIRCRLPPRCPGLPLTRHPGPKGHCGWAFAPCSSPPLSLLQLGGIPRIGSHRRQPRHPPP